LDCGTPSGLDTLIRKWVPLGDHWPGPHVALCMSGTWSGHANTMKHARNLWKCVAHHQGWMSQPGTGAIWVSPDKVVVQTIGVPFMESIYQTASISKKDYLTSLLHLCSHLLVYYETHPWMKVSLSLWSTPSLNFEARWCSKALIGLETKGHSMRYMSYPSDPLVFVLGRCIIVKQHPYLVTPFVFKQLHETSACASKECLDIMSRGCT